MAGPLAHTCQPRPPIRDIVIVAAAVVNVAATVAAVACWQSAVNFVGIDNASQNVCDVIYNMPQSVAIRNWNWNWNWFNLLTSIYFDTLNREMNCWQSKRLRFRMTLKLIEIELII